MNKEALMDPRSVFVRGISFDIGDAELTGTFSAVGPVKHAFIVKDTKGGQRHKGYGFVQFALQEDAERAVQELDGADLGGRKLKVEVAKKRAPLEERKKENKKKRDQQKQEQEQQEQEDDESHDEEVEEEQKPPLPPPAKKQRSKDPETLNKTKEKHALVRTLAIGGLTADTVDAAIALVKKLGGKSVEHVTYPAADDVVRSHKLKQDGCTGNVVLVRYTSTKEALASVSLLHHHPVTSLVGKKKKNKQDTEIKLWVRQVSGEGMHLKRWRLVVRNLSFTVGEDDVRAAFSPAGFVWEVMLPRGADGKPRGFAFVGFTCRAHAERGIALVNGTKVGARPVAVDWAVAKRDFEKAGDGAAPDTGPTTDEVVEDEEDDGSDDSEHNGAGQAKRMLVSTVLSI